MVPDVVDILRVLVQNLRATPSLTGSAPSAGLTAPPVAQGPPTTGAVEDTILANTAARPGPGIAPTPLGAKPYHPREPQMHAGSLLSNLTARTSRSTQFNFFSLKTPLKIPRQRYLGKAVQFSVGSIMNVVSLLNVSKKHKIYF